MEHSIYNRPRTYDKPHKFFDKYLTNDLYLLTNFLQAKYSQIESAEVPGVNPIGANGQEYWLESGSTSTVKWKEYNVFQFHSPEIHNLYLGVRETVKEACEYYEIDYDAQRYMVQGWFNINYTKKGKLDWHDHGGPWAPYFHGYYCVNSEPSSTYYRVNNSDNYVVENKNYNNRLIVSEMGHPHAMADWDWEGPRITIAYDIIPLKELIKVNAEEQHWFPL